MSSADLFEDGFPHGTKEGYDKGCRGHGSCPGVLEFGRSCNQASMHYSGDYEYRKRVDAGLGPAEIAELERAAVPAPKPSKRVSGSGTNQSPGFNERVHAEPTVTIASSETPLGDLADDLEVELAGEVLGAGGIPSEKHGTTAGYYAGCRLRDECPAKATTGVSCANAVAAYQRDRKATRDGLAPEPVKVPQSLNLGVVDGEEKVVEFPSLPLVESVPAEGILTELADTKEQLEAVRFVRDERDRELDAAHKRIAELEEQLVRAALTLDVELARSRDRDVVALRDAAPMSTAGLGLSFAPTADGGVSVQLEGGADPVHLELKFNNGRLIRAGVTTGA
jgi:hypothetical protein